jgi:hypothetical protein
MANVSYRKFTEQPQFDSGGKIQVDKFNKMLADPNDPFGLGDITSTAEIFELLHKSNYSYTFNELLFFLERLEVLNRANMSSFMASKQAVELIRAIKSKLRQLEATLQPYAKRRFFGDQPSAEELIEWADREHQRIMAKTNTPKVGKLCVLLNAINMFDPDIWITMEKLIINHQAENSLLETISAMEGFCSFAKILEDQQSTYQKLEAKYGPGVTNSGPASVALLQNSGYFIPKAIVTKHLGQQFNDPTLSNSNSETGKESRAEEIRKRVRKIYRVLERNMIVAMTDINVSHYARAVKALNDTQSPNKASFELLEYHTITNISLINDPKLVLKVYIEFAKSGHGSAKFFRAIESMFCENIVTDLRLSDFAKYLNNAENVGKLLEARSKIVARIPDMTMNIDLAASICAKIRSQRFEYRCSDIGRVLRYLSVVQLPDSETKELQGKLANDLLKALPREVATFRDFVQIFDSVRDQLAGHQKEKLFREFIDMARANKIAFGQDNWESFGKLVCDELAEDGLQRLGFANVQKLDSSASNRNSSNQ